jgi:hypothetical protein
MTFNQYGPPVNVSYLMGVYTDPGLPPRDLGQEDCFEHYGLIPCANEYNFGPADLDRSAGVIDGYTARVVDPVQGLFYETQLVNADVPGQNASEFLQALVAQASARCQAIVASTRARGDALWPVDVVEMPFDDYGPSVSVNYTLGVYTNDSSVAQRNYAFEKCLYQKVLVGLAQQYNYPPANLYQESGRSSPSSEQFYDGKGYLWQANMQNFNATDPASVSNFFQTVHDESVNLCGAIDKSSRPKGMFLVTIYSYDKTQTGFGPPSNVSYHLATYSDALDPTTDPKFTTCVEGVLRYNADQFNFGIDPNQLYQVSGQIDDSTLQFGAPNGLFYRLKVSGNAGDASSFFADYLEEINRNCSPIGQSLLAQGLNAEDAGSYQTTSKGYLGMTLTVDYQITAYRETNYPQRDTDFDTCVGAALKRSADRQQLQGAHNWKDKFALAGVVIGSIALVTTAIVYTIVKACCGGNVA